MALKIKNYVLRIHRLGQQHNLKMVGSCPGYTIVSIEQDFQSRGTSAQSHSIDQLPTQIDNSTVPLEKLVNEAKLAA